MRKLFVIFLLCAAAFAQANSVTLVKTKPTSPTQYTSFFTVSYYSGSQAKEVWFPVVSNNSDSASTVQTAIQNAAIQALSGVGVTAAATDIAMPVMQRGTTALGWNDIWGKPPTFTPSTHGSSAHDSSVTQNIASGTVTFTTTAIAAGACSSPIITVNNAAIQAGDSALIVDNSDFTTATDAMLITRVRVAAGSISFKRCNLRAASITPTAVTQNWKVVR